MVLGTHPKKKVERSTDPSQFKNKIIINQQAYFTDTIKINQVNSNVIIQNRQQRTETREPSDTRVA